MALNTGVGRGLTEYPVRNARGDNVAVDLHCHILPGLDDGARDLDDAIGMARQAQADGISAICATPHIRPDHRVVVGELPARLAELQAAITAAGCRTRVLPGGEVAVTALPTLTDEDLDGVSLGGSGRWILLEPDPGPLDDRLDFAVDVLCSRGFGAVVAHPERHLAPDLVARLSRLVGRGQLVQATAAALLDHDTRPGMLKLAAAGVLHVLGSDAHSSRVGRRVALAGALKVLGTAAPVATNLQWVAGTAPRAIVAGQELTAPFGTRR
jgi:protein-tyrosine phosphatase